MKKNRKGDIFFDLSHTLKLVHGEVQHHHHFYGNELRSSTLKGMVILYILSKSNRAHYFWIVSRYIAKTLTRAKRPFLLSNVIGVYFLMQGFLLFFFFLFFCVEKGKYY